jgi:hypothetical protein
MTSALRGDYAGVGDRIDLQHRCTRPATDSTQICSRPATDLLTELRSTRTVLN